MEMPGGGESLSPQASKRQRRLLAIVWQLLGVPKKIKMIPPESVVSESTAS
jgi:hypothetical protein